jgi:hypothetical protein
MYCLHLHDKRVSQITGKNKTAGRVRSVAYLLLAANLAYFSVLKMEEYIIPKQSHIPQDGSFV